MTRHVLAGALAILIWSSGAAGALPIGNIKAEGLVADPSGQFAYFSGAVSNRGPAPQTNVRIDLYVDGELRGSQVWLVLNTGWSWVSFWVGDLSEGSHDATMVVDPADEIAETDESDNTAMTEFVIGPADPEAGVDLVVGPIDAPATSFDGENVGLWVRFGNAGNATGSSSFVIEFRLDGQTMKRNSWPPGIPAGWMGWDYASFKISGEGAHVIEVVIDADGQMVETNETNNVANATVVVEPPSRVSVSVDLRRLPLTTEAGDVRHPLSRWEAIVQLCEDSGVTARYVETTFAVHAGNGRSQGVGSEHLGTRWEDTIAGNTCIEYVVRFDSPGAVGDFTFVADAWAPNDITPEDNHAEEAGYNLVEGEGGVVVGPGVGERP